MNTVLASRRIWKNMKLETCTKTGADFCTALEQADFRIGDWARDILHQKAFAMAAEPAEVNLVVMSVKDLRLNSNACYNQICTRAKEMGLELCPPKVGPLLRLLYIGQPRNEWLIITMEAIRVSDGGLRIFLVGHDDAGRWLHSRYGYPNSAWRPDYYRFVFVARK